MAPWDDPLPVINDDGMPEWMSQTAASQLIWYQREPAYGGARPRARGARGGAHGGPSPPPGGAARQQRSNYRIFEDPTSLGYCYGAREFSVELRVPICCEGCAEKVRSRLIEIDGVRAVDVDEGQKTVTVSGTPDVLDVFNACKKIFRRSKWRPA